MSIDAPNAQMPVKAGASDDFNYIDTYVEYIAEVVLKFTNAIPESKDRQQKELQQHKQFEITFEKLYPIMDPLAYQQPKIVYRHLADKNAYQFIREINPPPPKV